jgi:hypothetical protein
VTAPRVVVAGGHSAGHIEPTMNFADALRRLEPTAEITALGTLRGLDTTLIPARGYPSAPMPRTQGHPGGAACPQSGPEGRPDVSTGRVNDPRSRGAV